MERDDAAALAALLAPIVADGRFTAMGGPVDEATQRAFFEELPPRAVFLACVDESGRIVGMQDVVPADDETGEVSTFVALDCARRGVGRALWSAMLPAVAERGYLRLRAVIRADNPRGVAFYRACGFEGPDGERQTVLSRPVSCGA